MFTQGEFYTWVFLKKNFSVSDILLLANININFSLDFEQQNKFYKKQGCPITSPLPVAEIWAYIAKFYWQNSDF